MGGTTMMVEEQTEKEVNRRLAQLKREAQRHGLMDERTRYVGYDEKKKVWRGYLWMHS